jgi:CHAT domain-containing protein
MTHFDSSLKRQTVAHRLPLLRAVLPRVVSTAACFLFIAVLNLSAPAPLYIQQASAGTLSFSGIQALGQVSEARQLDTGVPVRRVVGQGEVHEYLLALGADEYARLTLRQEGVDVVLELAGAGLPETLEVDKANGSTGLESVSILGGERESYRLRVRAREQEPEPGSYELLLAERRPATPADRERVATERLFLEGERLRKGGRRAALEQGVSKLEEARSRWGRLGERREEAFALLGLGGAYFYLNQMPESLASYEQALDHFRLLKSRLDEGVALRSIGITRLSIADNEGALRSFRQSLDIFRAEGDRKYIGATLYQMGRVFYLEGDLTEAMRYYEEALPIRRQLNDRIGEAYTLLSIGRVHANGFSNYEQALGFYQRALVLLRPGVEHRPVAQALGDLGRLDFSRGDQQAALTQYRKALAEIGDRDPLVQAEILMYVGVVYAAQGRHREALDDYFDKALELQRKGADRIGEGHTLKNMGLSYAALGDDAEALRHLGAALNIWGAVLYRTAEADTRYEIARVESRRGNLEQARLQIEAAFPTIETLRTKISNQHLRTSYFASAQKYYELYIDVLMRLSARTGDRALAALALSYSERARTRSMLDTLIEAHAEVRRGAKAEDLAQEAALQRKLSALSQRQLINARYTPEQAAAARQGLDALITEYHALEARIRESSPRYAGLTRPQPLTLEMIQGLLAPDQMLLEYALGDERSYLWAVTAASFESHVLPGSAEIERAAGRVHRLLIERNRSLPGETEVGALMRVKRADEEYALAARSLSEMLLAPVKSLPKVLSLMVVMSGKLQYIPFAALPVAERDTPERQTAGHGRGTVPLLYYHEVETLPSLSVLVELKRQESDAARSRASKLVAIIADPVFSPDDDRLRREVTARLGADGGQQRGRVRQASPPTTSGAQRHALGAAVRLFEGGRVPRLLFSRREAKAILALVPEGQQADLMLDFRARREVLTNDNTLSDYRIVHFATHGLVNSEHPELSGILLSLYDDKGRALDGLVQMHEIYNLSIPAELVVLSACETGVGKEIKGEGLAALSRAYIYAGARRVVASLWEVSDDSTAQLMEAFYRNLFSPKKVRAAAALRAAQLEMWSKDPKGSPYSWAAFITLGDPRF